MNKNLKIALILLSTIALGTLGVRQSINAYENPQRILFKALGTSIELLAGTVVALGETVILSPSVIIDS